MGSWLLERVEPAGRVHLGDKLADGIAVADLDAGVGHSLDEHLRRACAARADERAQKVGLVLADCLQGALNEFVGYASGSPREADERSQHGGYGEALRAVEGDRAGEVFVQEARDDGGAPTQRTVFQAATELQHDAGEMEVVLLVGR